MHHEFRQQLVITAGDTWSSASTAMPAIDSLEQIAASNQAGLLAGLANDPVVLCLRGNEVPA